MSDPFRISARAALRRGARELYRAPAPSLAAILGALTAALAARSAWLRAAAALLDARPGRAALTWLVGLGLGALLADSTRAVALTAYAGPPRPLGRTLALGLARTPSMVAIRAVELLVYFTLGLGELFVFARALPRAGTDPAHQALLATAALAPALALAVALFAASRIAQTLVAHGLPAAAALSHGYDLVLRRFASLARLALCGIVLAAPLLVVAALTPFPLRAALFAAVALWLYAALSTLVGHDPRLSSG